MTHPAYQWRPIRGRRFDSGRLLGALRLIVAGAFGVAVLALMIWIVPALLAAAERYLVGLLAGWWPQ